jgi:single-stranded-DNA-specific exonuclease
VPDHSTQDTTIRRRQAGEHNTQLPGELHPILRRIYLSRELQSAAELEHSFKVLPPFTALKGIAAATELLVTALAEQRHILIVADFDCDGATSCAVGMGALRAMGAARVSYVVPDRFKYGYGLTPGIVAVAAEQQPDLLITVDNGISSIDGVAAAKARGMQVLITDHHLPGRELPAADAIVNPNQPGDEFPSKNLAGVGVIFYVMLALRARLRELDWFNDQRPEPNLAEFLDLVALGTVADVVPLDHLNRVLVSQGLARMRRGLLRPGIRALCEVAGRQPERLVSSDMGFCIGPRLNAAGRLDDMSIGIECLLSDSLSNATELAEQLDQLNRERRSIETTMQKQALTLLGQLDLDSSRSELPWGLSLYNPNWHQGVVGLLASRIKEKTHRPVIAFAPGDDGDDDDANGELKGSARSIPGLHIRDALDAIATRHPGLITRFGGHAMAAGLSLPAANLPAFRRAFDQQVHASISEDALQGVILSDGELTPDDFTLDLAETLRSAGPWGQGFPEPLFDGVFALNHWRVVGHKHLKMKLEIPGRHWPIDAIAFNTVEADLPDNPDNIRIAYKLDVNEYKGERTPQLLVTHIAPA